MSCCLLIGWFNGNIEAPGLTSGITIESKSAKPTVSLSIPSALKQNITTTNQNTVWDSLRSEFKLDHKTDSTAVKAEIRKLLADQGKLRSILNAAVPYIYFIHKQVEARGLPAELALIPVIESEFNPNDKSNKGATGLWQLMPATARDLGIKVQASYDGRRNVIASTKAALAYFKDLGNLFKGNWYLAIAAYNCGEGKVMSAQKKAGGSDSFWHLHLPKETQLYVPKLLAVAAIVNNPQKYGIELPNVTNKPYFQAVKVKVKTKTKAKQKTLDLKKVAKSSNINIKTLNALNPDLRHDMVAIKDSHTVLVPVAKAPQFKANFDGTVFYSEDI